MQLMGSFSLAELHQLDFLHAAGHFDFRAVVQVVAAGALHPDIFAALFCHDITCG
jgi:hypothetical protein